MKGAKGGKRDRIISFLFSKKNEEQANENKKDDVINSESEKRTYNPEKTVSEEAIDNVKEDQKNTNTILKQQTVVEEDNYDNNLPEKSPTLEESTSDEIEPDKYQNKYLLEDTAEFTLFKSQETNQNEYKSEENNEHKSNYSHVTSKPDVSPTNSHSNKEEEQEKTFVEPQPEEVNDLEDQEIIEKSVVDALERIIKEDIYELEQIQYELEILEQKEEDEALTDEVEKLKQRLEELIKKFEKIKDIYYKSIDSEDLTTIDDDELYNLVVDYKENYKDSDLMEVVETEIKVIESYVSLIEQITSVEKSKDEIDEKIDEKLDKFQIRDDEFEEMKKDYENIDEISNTIEKFNNEQEKIMKELEEKMKHSEEISSKIERTIEIVPHFNRLIQAAIMISMSKRVPPTPRGNLIKASLMVSAISMAAHFITREEKETKITTIKYKDFSNDIRSIGKDISSIIYKIDDAFDDINLIRENFKKNCEEYAGQIPEYDEFIKNLDRVEKELKEKQDIAKKYNKDFNKMLHINNEKIKKLEKENNTQSSAA